MDFHRRTILRGLASLTVPLPAFIRPAAATDKVKIGFLLKTMQEERYQRDKAAFLAKAKALGAEVIFDSANNDEQTQLAAFENMLSRGAQAIVLQPVNHVEIDVDPRELPRALRDLMPAAEPFSARFELPPAQAQAQAQARAQAYLNRAHPAVEGLASFVVGNALEDAEHARARRVGVIRTRVVARRTTLILTRMRFAAFGLAQ